MSSDARKASVLKDKAQCSGTLLKRTTGITKHFKRRYVELGGHYLRVYQDAKTASPATLKESIDVNGIESITCSSDDRTISLRLDTGVVLAFKAEDRPSFDKWQSALQGAKQVPGTCDKCGSTNVVLHNCACMKKINGHEMTEVE